MQPTRKAADLMLRPAPRMPPVNGATIFNLKTPWLRGSGAAAVMAPISDQPIKPKLETGHGDILRKALRVSA
jgi:hypothetical protein